MFTRIRLENFKSWRELDIALAPITVLFGTNSSGKSSVLQSILLLMQSSDKHWLDYVDFGSTDKDFVTLGSYKDVVYKHDISKEIGILFTFSQKSHKDDMKVELSHEDEDTRIRGKKIEHVAELFVHLYENQKFLHLGPLRQHPQRSYLWSGAAPRRIEKDGENTIAALVKSTRRDGKLLKHVAEWLVKMGLVDSFNVAALDKDNRFYETLVTVSGVQSALLDTGFGVSQVLPVVTMLFFAPEGSIILLEQPELHLHPSAQAHLADLMLHVAEERNVQLIVESHSEHLLRRLQRRIAEVEYDFAQPDNVKMYFCDKGKNGSTIQSVEVDQYGQINNWPDKFFGDITGDLEAMTRAALQRSLNGGK